MDAFAAGVEDVPIVQDDGVEGNFVLPGKSALSGEGLAAQRGGSAGRAVEAFPISGKSSGLRDAAFRRDVISRFNGSHCRERRSAPAAWDRLASFQNPNRPQQPFRNQFIKTKVHKKDGVLPQIVRT